MKQTMKKAIAIICAIAMVVSSFTVYNKTASAAVADLPESGAGVVIQVNDFGTGEVLFLAGLDTIAGATSYNLYMDGTLWGTVTNGANLELTNFPSGAHTFCVTGVNADGEFAKSRDISVTIPNYGTVTTPEVVDGTELLKGLTFADADTTTDEATTESLWIELGGTYTNNGDGSVSVSVLAYESGDNWATQLKQNNVQLVKDKWYVAKFKVTSDVDKKIQMLVQQNVNWTVFAEKIVAVAAGTTEEVEVVFQATQTTDKVLFGFMMGYVDNTACEVANVTISDVSLTAYNANPNGDTEPTTADNSSEQPSDNDETTTPDSSGEQPSDNGETTTPGEQITGPEYTYAAGSTELMDASYLAGEVGANQYKAICGSGVVSGIVNIQQYGAATEPGIYVSFRDADFGEMTVNGKSLNAYVDGAGMIMYLSNFEYMYNDVVIKNGAGAEKAVLYVYNAQGIDNSDKILEAPTSPSDKETTTPSNKEPQSEYTYAAGYDWFTVGFLKSADAGRGQFRAVCGSGVISEIVNIQQAGSATEPGIYVTFTDGDFGEVTINGVPLECSIDGSGITMYLSNFEYYYSDVVVRNSDGSVKAVIYVNYMYGIDNSDMAIEGTPDPSTQAPTTPEPTTPAPTTPSVVDPTTVAPTTVAPTTTKQDVTVAPTTAINVKVTTPGKAKINKINAKKKAAKKVNLTLKKIKSAAGYQVAVYKTKKNAKKNKKAIVIKTVKKIKATIKSKKLKNKKKLFVRARAYVLDANGTKVYGKWSKVKKVKIKK